MQTTVENTDKHTVKLTIEVPVDEFTKDLDRAYRSIANQVKVPGFRKGKVPKKIIDAQIGRDVVREEFLSSSVPIYFRDAVREEDLAPISDPEIQLEQVEDDKPLIFTATVEVRPRLQLSAGRLQGSEGREARHPGDRRGDRRVGRSSPRAVRRAGTGRPPRGARGGLRHHRRPNHPARRGRRRGQPHRLPLLRGLGRVRPEARRGARRHEARRHPEGERRAARSVRRARRHRREHPGPGEGREGAQAPRGRRRVREDRRRSSTR